MLILEPWGECMPIFTIALAYLLFWLCCLAVLLITLNKQLNNKQLTFPWYSKEKVTYTLVVQSHDHLTFEPKVYCFLILAYRKTFKVTFTMSWVHGARSFNSCLYLFSANTFFSIFLGIKWSFLSVFSTCQLLRTFIF